MCLDSSVVHPLQTRLIREQLPNRCSVLIPGITSFFLFLSCIHFFVALWRPVVAGMQYWPDKAATMLALIDDWIVVGRGDISDTAVVALAQQYLPHDPASRPVISVVRIAPEFAAVSSTKIRTDVKDLLSMTDPRVLQYVFSHNTTANGYSQLDLLYQLHTVE